MILSSSWEVMKSAEKLASLLPNNVNKAKIISQLYAGKWEIVEGKRGIFHQINHLSWRNSFGDKIQKFLIFDGTILFHRMEDKFQVSLH